MSRYSGLLLRTCACVLVQFATISADAQEVFRGDYEVTGVYSARITGPGSWAQTAQWRWTHAEAVASNVGSYSCTERIPAPQTSFALGTTVQTARIEPVVAPRTQGERAGRFKVLASDHRNALNFSSGGCVDWENASPSETIPGVIYYPERAEVIWRPCPALNTGQVDVEHPACWQKESSKGADELWYRWWSRFNWPSEPDPFPFVKRTDSGQFQIFTQFHQYAGGSPWMALTLRNPGATPANRFTSFTPEDREHPARVWLAWLGGDEDLGPIVRGRWVEFVLHVKWSRSASAGFVEVWHDGNLVVPRKMGPTLGAAGSAAVFLKQGLYRNDSVEDATLFHDGLSVSLNDPRAVAQSSVSPTVVLTPTAATGVTTPLMF